MGIPPPLMGGMDMYSAGGQMFGGNGFMPPMSE